jgi:hypothetical protein
MLPSLCGQLHAGKSCPKIRGFPALRGFIVQAQCSAGLAADNHKRHTRIKPTIEVPLTSKQVR